MLAMGSGLYVGWVLGANNASNMFGTAVASRTISYRHATILCAVAVLLGAAMQGTAGIATLSGLSALDYSTLLLVSVSTAITITLMTFFRLPVSVSQGVIGAIAAVGMATDTMKWNGLIKVGICWVATPIGAMILAWLVYHAAAWFFRKVPMSILTRDRLIWWGLICMGVYGSYALGANNVANATGIFSGQFNGVSDEMLATLGGIAIAVGVLTYSRRVMMSVGNGILTLDAFTAFVAVAAMSMVVHIFAMVGVPVSTSQGIVGAVFGIGLIRGVHNVRFGMLRNIAIGWLLTPTIAFLLAAAGFAIFRLALHTS